MSLIETIAMGAPPGYDARSGIVPGPHGQCRKYRRLFENGVELLQHVQLVPDQGRGIDGKHLRLGGFYVDGVFQLHVRIDGHGELFDEHRLTVADDVIIELLRGFRILGVLDDGDGALDDGDVSLGVGEAHGGSLGHDGTGDVVHADGNLVFSRGGLVNHGAGTVLELQSVGLQLLQVGPAIFRVLDQPGHGEQGGAAGGGVGHGKVILEFWLQQVFPCFGDLVFLHEVGVVHEAEHDQPGGHVEPVGILELVGDPGGRGGIVGHQEVLLLEGQVVGGVAHPDDVGRDAAGLVLRGEFGHDIAGAGGVVVHGHVGVLLHEALPDGCELGILQRGIEHDVLLLFGRRCRLREGPRQRGRQQRKNERCLNKLSHKNHLLLELFFKTR
ncbi:hypothetical protein SDC9_40486 [bioreactor metagenome]|uniref:Uncharacterized protein n=1 Tax=bioreactor metagenome TaxID=1076179 RepID=A0A644VVE9_9ZZZZ